MILEQATFSRQNIDTFVSEKIGDNDYKIIVTPINEDEVLIFEIAKSKKGKDMEDLEIVLDEKIIEKVMEKYNKLYDEMFENESKPEEEVKKNGRK